MFSDTGRHGDALPREDACSPRKVPRRRRITPPAVRGKQVGHGPGDRAILAGGWRSPSISTRSPVTTGFTRSASRRPDRGGSRSCGAACRASPSCSRGTTCGPPSSSSAPISEEDAEGRALLAELARAGHELANHTHTHRYDFARLPRAAMAEEIDRAHAVVGRLRRRGAARVSRPGLRDQRRGARSAACARLSLRLVGVPVGGLLRRQGAGDGGDARWRGGRRAAFSTTRACCWRRARPYRPAPTAPYRHGGDGLLELPIAVTPLARLHVIGTSLILAPPWLRRHLVSTALRAPFFNLELHGIDLADAEADEIPPALIARQPDLRRPLAHKLAALDETLTAARPPGARFVTLREYSA